MDEKNRAWVEKMIQGHEPAFDEVYRSYSGKLYRMAYFITGNKSDSEDVLQEVFVSCFLHRGDLKNPECFETWIYRILVRTAWKLCRKRKEVSLDAYFEHPEDAGLAQRLHEDSQAGPLEQLLEKEDASELWDRVSKLDVKYRTVILLYYYNGLGTREIARITGTLEGTVKSRLFQARKLLQKGLWQEERGMHFEGKMG